MSHEFVENGKFAVLATSIYRDESSELSEFSLSDGTWVLPRVPGNLRTWRDWLGSLRIDQNRIDQITEANLVLLAEVPSDHPEILDDQHTKLGENLGKLFKLLHLRSGLEYELPAERVFGGFKNGEIMLRSIGRVPKLYQIKGYRRGPVTKEWLEDTSLLRGGLADIEANKGNFGRVIRGLNTLIKGQGERSGQDGLHQFVSSLEALIFPEISKTKKQFKHRCRTTFAKDRKETESILDEAYEMRSDTEHLHDWDEAMKSYAPSERENVCLQRTRQIEQLACHAYSRILRDKCVREHFNTDSAIRGFWKLPDGERRKIWGEPFDLASEPLFTHYDQWGRGST